MIKKNIYFLISFLIFFASCKKDDIEPKQISVQGGLPYEFINLESKTNTHSYIWDFGDGMQSNDVNPTHIYKYTGNYFVNVSVFNNDKFLYNKLFYKVNVTKIKRPRVHAIIKPVYNYNYLYKNQEIKLNFDLSYEQEDTDYKYYILIDDSVEYYQKNNTYTFLDTGYHKLTFKLTDKYGITGRLDTTIYVGDVFSTINFKVPQTYISQLGTITECYIIFVDVSFAYNDFNDIWIDIGNYPNNNNKFIIYNNGEYESYHYFSSINYYDYATLWFNPIIHHDITGITDNTYMSVYVPSSDWDNPNPNEYNDMKAIVLLIGSNGKAYGSQKIDIIPGRTSYHSISITFHNY